MSIYSLVPKFLPNPILLGTTLGMGQLKDTNSTVGYISTSWADVIKIRPFQLLFLFLVPSIVDPCMHNYNYAQGRSCDNCFGCDTCSEL